MYAYRTAFPNNCLFAENQTLKAVVKGTVGTVQNFG
jgi:hypothetical protein